MKNMCNLSTYFFYSQAKRGYHIKRKHKVNENIMCPHCGKWCFQEFFNRNL